MLALLSLLFPGNLLFGPIPLGGGGRVPKPRQSVPELRRGERPPRPRPRNASGRHRAQLGSIPRGVLGVQQRRSRSRGGGVGESDRTEQTHSHAENTLSRLALL